MVKVSSSWVVLVFVLFSFRSNAQIAGFDKMEMYYAQGHYKMVYRKANQLLDKPDYDFSQVPSFYKSLSLFQLSQNEYWFKHHADALEDARVLFLKVKQSPDGVKIFSAHQHEIAILKNDLLSWIDELKRQEKNEMVVLVEQSMKGLFDKIPGIDTEGEVDTFNPTISGSKMRNEVIALALKQVGVPYLWAGTSPSGFDCSGFTGYVMKSVGKDLPRRAADQEKLGVKVKEKNVQKGDLVFFDNGSGVSHVGIIVSEKGAPLQMVHSSSSKGVIVTDITKSEYWMTRIYSFASILD